MSTIGLKKTDNAVDNSPKTVAEMDELYWFINKKGRSRTRENVYIITLISREPRQKQFRVGGSHTFEVKWNKGDRFSGASIEPTID